MKVRLAVPDEAPALWNIRNQAIRNGCRESYAAAVLEAWTPDTMPEGYRHAVCDNPCYVVEEEGGQPVATGGRRCGKCRCPGYATQFATSL